ncbi:MAG: 50S ribosomal protein L4 [Candidatus Pacebacteria bacterium]|nr:50S ribosomal protein L4 [Candidatus Paceibacterota bacterium]
MKTPTYNSKGKSAGEVTLPESVFAQVWNGDLVHQVLHAITANTRAGTADTKGRAEVRGGGKKPWKQKGTGRARHGSSRSPIWKGGGVTHGPLAEKNYKQKINKKMSAKALATVLSAKLKDGQILFVDSLDIEKTPKTSLAAEMVQAFAGVQGFEKLAKARKPKAMMIIPSADKVVSKSFRNVPQITLGLTKDLNTFDVLNHQYLIVVDPKVSVAALEKRCVVSKKK